MVALVFVDVKHQAVDRAFDYLVPNHLKAHIHIGQRVKIPFGTRTITGIVIDLKADSKIKNLKAILAILDLEPLYSKELLDLASWLSYQHFSLKTAYLQAMIPSALRMTYKKVLKIKNKAALPESLLNRFNRNQEADFERFQNDLDSLSEALKKGDLIVETKLKQKLGVASEDLVFLIKKAEVKGAKQNAILHYLKDHDGCLKTTLLSETKSSHSSLNSLIKKEYIKVQSKESYRVIKSLYDLKPKTITLTDEQQLAYTTIIKNFNHYQTYLLHGITSSGKTEVYIKLAETLLNQGKSTLVLVPEISLTPALAARFKAVFKEDVVLYHSRLSDGERYDEWRKAKQREAVVMIGVRSAVFAPLNNLGLIVMDEEHSDSYRQEDHPKYHAKEVALKRAETNNIPLVLGSATPKVESYYLASTEKYTLLKLEKRALNSVLPTIHLIDMKTELEKGNMSIFSEPVFKAMEKQLESQSQTLILINRRGHANFVLCRECGKAIKCLDCDITMTYHHHDQTLKCHYCNTKIPVPKTCPTCGSKHIRYMGIGSERVEEELKKSFQEATIVRMDQDTTTQKNAHETLLHKFEHQGDFLVGTQMISKGLDFSRVGLVIILSADMALNIPDYYAQEDAFHLFMQMAGRSGRREHRGDVYIQAYNPNHSVLKHVQNHDYQGFYEAEIAWRKQLDIPPFKEVLQITIKHPYKNKAFTKASIVIKELRNVNNISWRIIGPITPKIHKLHNQYRNQIIIKHDDQALVLKTLHHIFEKLDLEDATLVIDYHMTL